MFENHPKINDENNLVPEKTIVIVPKVGVSRESINKVLEPLKGNLTRDFLVPASSFCLPLTIANQYGFVIKNDKRFVATWDEDKPMIWRYYDEGKPILDVGNSPQPNAINIKLPFVLRTSPMMNLMVIPPINYELSAGLTALSAVIETDNLQFDFTINLIMREAGAYVIEAGQPIATLLPIPRGLADDFSLKFAEDLYDKKIVAFEQLSQSQVEHNRETIDRERYKKTGRRKRDYYKGIDSWGNPFRFPHQKH